MNDSFKHRWPFYDLGLRTLIGCLMALVATNGQAQIEVTLTACFPIDLPNHELYTVTVTSSTGPITALQANFQGLAINQVNPLGVPTVFDDFNVFFDFVGAHPTQDSQFLFNSNDVLIGLANESSTELRAAFIYPGTADFGHQVDLAQIVIPENFGFTYEVGAVVNGELNVITGPRLGDLPGGLPGDNCIPEPSTAALALIGMSWLVRRRD